ncbi:proteasome subunit alpha type-6-like isoform X2 [Nymphaea colorata]|uniref:proteasome subunit alpha type-6-like isoform X2 n=1 Tax=Nymphaea colorata TaxID=210225 RepID=UPI00129EC962|nr:proteasome subunit alpha type-6-like isoform X2 [Nymphaea colorata]XP_031480693.1 proteasome subunit alpha type-6-like isoform X2 [Nymphaea colorata]
MFFPEDRLYQVEYALKAVKAPSITSISVRGNDSVCVVTQMKDKLLDLTSITRLFPNSKYLGLLATGVGKELVIFKAFSDEPCMHWKLKERITKATSARLKEQEAVDFLKRK